MCGLCLVLTQQPWGPSGLDCRPKTDVSASVCVFMCVFACFSTSVKHVCVEYAYVHSCLRDPNVSITAETPLCQRERTWPTCISLCLLACFSASVSLFLCLLIFINVFDLQTLGVLWTDGYLILYIGIYISPPPCLDIVCAIKHGICVFWGPLCLEKGVFKSWNF